MDAHHLLFPSGLLYAVNTAFFLGFIWRSFLDFSYIEALVHERGRFSRFPRWLVELPAILTSILILSSPLTGLVFSIDAQGYHSGLLYRIIYANAYFYLLLMMLLSYIGLRRFSWNPVEKASLIGD